jgi:HAD superfamily hydrolase (TIGR01509 family)
MLSAILFDLDGTLVNTDPLHFQTWQKVLTDFGLFIDRHFYNKYISGRLNAEIVKDILPQLPQEEGLKVAEAKEALFRDLATQLQPTPGLQELLDWSDKLQLKQAVVTNAPRENARFLLEVLGLSTVFPLVILAEDASKGKPDPAPYQLALTRLEIKSYNAIGFEDSPSGLRSSTGAGIRSIGIASNHEPEHLLNAGAEQVIKDFQDLNLWEWLNKEGSRMEAGNSKQ